MKVKSESEVSQLCLTLSDPIDCSVPGSSIHGIFQARVLEWAAIAFSKNSIETCILSYVKQIASAGSMHETVCSGLVHWDDPEGSDGEGGGRGVQDREHMHTMVDSCQCVAKTTTIL